MRLMHSGFQDQNGNRTRRAVGRSLHALSRPSPRSGRHVEERHAGGADPYLRRRRRRHCVLQGGAGRQAVDHHGQAEEHSLRRARRAHHQNPVCDAPDFKAPAATSTRRQAAWHGQPDGPPQRRHAEEHLHRRKPHGEITFKVDYLSLTPGAANSVFGHSIMVHEKADDMKTDPTGHAGNGLRAGDSGGAVNLAGGQASPQRIAWDQTGRTRLLLRSTRPTPPPVFGLSYCIRTA